MPAARPAAATLGFLVLSGVPGQGQEHVVE
jgi:hypothetical protein